MRSAGSSGLSGCRRTTATSSSSSRPDLFIVGGGVSKHADSFLPLLKLSTPIVPAVHRNNAGIIGAAALALA